MKLCKTLLFISLFGFIVSCNKREDKVSYSFKSITNHSLERVEPPNWFIGFKEISVQLLVKDPAIGLSKPSISYAGVTIEKIHKARSENYLFIDLKIHSSTKPGKFDIVFRFDNGSKKTHTYQLKARQKSADDYVGFNSADAIYLITPDRFSNADETNDINKGLKETTIDRTDGYKRHGGDLEGIINHIDYISD